MAEPSGPELVIGLVGAIGADLGLVVDELKGALSDVSYTTEEIRVVDLLHDIERWKDLPHHPEEVRYEEHIRAGGQFCQEIGRGDALALLSIARIRKLRRSATGDWSTPRPRHCYILRSLKRPREIETLRRVYGSGFLLVAAYCPREIRVDYLASRFASSHHDFDSSKYRSKAEELVEIDEREQGHAFGQDVRGAFPMADLFINAKERADITHPVKRFVRILFGYPFHTPTRDEQGLMHARVAALRSSDLSRQVGCAICTQDGDPVALGCNDVPKVGGGLYWEGDSPDGRDFNLGHDTGFAMRRLLLADALKRLEGIGWLSVEKSALGIESMLNEALATDPPSQIREARLMDVIEFGRTVHAEMDAITAAARRGAPLSGCTLYTTTFPCHICARHIVSSGISRVVYIEPYHKSLASDLFKDSITVDDPHQPSAYVNFDHFVGIAPSRYLDVFQMVQRRLEDGSFLKWNAATSVPRLSGSAASYLKEELSVVTKLEEGLNASGLQPVN